ncbi:hypothetical protein [Streptomyces swartbergensis]|uniref:hypothetical protein n=1 Tax=Streptomyces swartbergensis TaxID=487165 RepID=UPI0038184166
MPSACVAPDAPLRAVEQLVERLRSVWPTDPGSTVYWNVSYLAVKLCVRAGADTAGPGQRVNGKKGSSVSLATSFDLVREDDLVVLTAARSEVAA